MKRRGVINTIVLALASALGLLIWTADTRELASVDLTHPGTLLAFVAKRLHAVPSYGRDAAGALGRAL